MPKKTKKYHSKFSEKDSEKIIQWRLIVLVFFWVMGFGLIMAKLVYVQVIDPTPPNIIPKTRELPARRGTIYDRNGEILAIDLVYYSLAAFPDKVDNRSTTARQISKITRQSASEVLQKIGSHPTFAYIIHRLSPDQANAIRELGIKGLVLEKKYSRYYPYRKNGAHLIGYCDFSNNAQAGIELEYDKDLKGLPGHAVYLRDGKGSSFFDLNYPLFNPIDGKNVVTTIDIVLQSILEEELQKGVEEHQGMSGSAVLLNARTGEILGLANSPGFDPNDYNKYPVKNYRNAAVSDQYEPGSTFKIIALAMVLEQLKLDLNANTVFCENGSYRVFRKTIRDHKKFGKLTLEEVFENSSNIGTIKLAEKFDPPVFYRYARDFGFGTLTGIDLPAECGGILHKPSEFTKASPYYMSIGYEVAATPLQIACAYAAIANGGKLLKPYVVRNVIDTDGHISRNNHPQVIRQVISSMTAVEMINTLHGVVENGTGQSAQIAGISIAGKTGTAQKMNEEKTHHISKYIASFVGFFPVESPRYVLMIMVNEPKGGYYGSQVAAPIFRNIAQRIIGLPQNDDLALVPSDYLHLDENDGPREVALAETDILEEQKPDYKVIPASRKMTNEKIEHPVMDPSVSKKTNPDVIPSFIGLTLREALEKLSQLDLKPDFEGNGIVVEQYPKPGLKLNKGSKIKLVCSAS